MIFFFLVGLVVALLGRIKLMRGFALQGKPARLYGVTLMVIAFPATWITQNVIGRLIPAEVLAQGPVPLVLNTALFIAIAAGVMIPFRRMPTNENAQKNYEAADWGANRNRVGGFLALSLAITVGSFWRLMTLIHQESENLERGQAPSSFTSHLPVAFVGGLSSIVAVFFLYLFVRSFFVQKKSP